MWDAFLSPESIPSIQVNPRERVAPAHPVSVEECEQPEWLVDQFINHAEDATRSGTDKPDRSLDDWIAATFGEDILLGPDEEDETVTNMFLLDTLDSMPRLRVSDSLMKVFLWILKECGAPDVPSFKQMRTTQATLRETTGVTSTLHKSTHGNLFYMNDIRRIISDDYANPLVRPHIHIYPEIPDDGPRHYYVLEFARLKNGDFVVPARWLTHKGHVKADVFQVKESPDGTVSIDTDQTMQIDASDLQSTYPELVDQGLVPVCHDVLLGQMPNCDREIAGGLPLYTSFVDYFGDDVSGNRSKAWNKHWNSYISHRNLPRKLLQQEFHVHFLSSSPNATIPEQLQSFISTVEDTHKNPIVVYDASTCGLAKVRLQLNADPSDNPMQSEIAGHIGGKGNYLCRRCKAGGTMLKKEADEGYHKLFSPGEPRCSCEIIESLRKQLKLACSGVKARVTKEQSMTGIKDGYTQYWIDQLLGRAQAMKNEGVDAVKIEQELTNWVEDNESVVTNKIFTVKGFDPTQDSPIEILHTILLGIVKYVWHFSHTKWTNEQKRLYSVWLQSTNTDGLNIPPIRAGYILQYAGSLIGRQFKTIAQTNTFHTHDICDPHIFYLWKAVGELTTLLWVPEIDDLEQYLDDVDVAANNVLNGFALFDPTKIISKVKLHILGHLQADIRRFGPMVGSASEIFECFNAVFRACSILSNRQAPSRDIANQLGKQEGFKHRASGGWWKSDGEWVQAGPGVRHFAFHRPLFLENLGWSSKNSAEPGKVQLSPFETTKAKSQARPCILWCQTQASHTTNSASYVHLHRNLLLTARHLVARSSDLCRVDSWVVAHSPHDDSVVEILATSETDTDLAITVIDIFDLKAACHPIFGMPILARSSGQPSYIIVPVKNIQFAFNVQHDCATAKCTNSRHAPHRQERLELEATEPVIAHKPLDEYLINTHSLHNAHLLWKAIPCNLISLIPLFPPNQAVTAWRLNPKSHTTQEQVRQAKKEAAEKEKKGKRGKKRTVEEAFADEADMKPKDLEDRMTLISNLTKVPPFLSELVEGQATSSTPPVP
ncbi:hypothetical protein BDM02DRAFT_3157045 [Thelephora ganbajun]|uniref:Uncharacterized protein n=1 Tax=Thelephora ganbajun TaxID=370292 RepID=A0ACB6Z5W2_THEGA|nr:hypothetical protein BDM02DRAFT_3157045 [Thelephora ganbajun]